MKKLILITILCVSFSNCARKKDSDSRPPSDPKVALEDPNTTADDTSGAYLYDSLANFDSSSLPCALQKIVTTEPLPPNVILVHIENQATIFYALAPKEQGIERLQIVYTALEKIRALGWLPTGSYLLNWGDGQDSDNGWPILTFSSTSKLVESGAAVLFPDFEALIGHFELFKGVDEGIEKYPWDKKESKIFWRGTTTNDARTQFIDYARDLPFVDAAFAMYAQFPNKKAQQAFAEKYPLKPFISPKDAMAYKYLIDIDGNASTYSRMAWILSSNSLLLKHKSNFVQWYHHRLKENVHYLPIERDFSNLKNQFDWAEANPELAEIIAKTGYALGRDVFNLKNIYRDTVESLLTYKEVAKAAETAVTGQDKHPKLQLQEECHL